MFSLKWAPKVSTCYVRNSDVKWRLIEGTVVLIDPADATLSHFNELGSCIWQELDGSHALDAITARLAEKFDAPLQMIRKDMIRFVKRLRQMELIRESDEP